MRPGGPRPRRRSLTLVPALVAALACGGPGGETGTPAPAVGAGADPAPHPAPAVVFLGDSLTAGLGLAEEEAFPARIADLLAAQGRRLRVVNAGVSGDTSTGGLARLDWLLRQEPDVLVVGLGANDGLRGIPPETTADNLRRIVRGAREAGSEVLLLGMRLPPNYGPDHVQRFEALYPRLAADLEVPFVPFLLEGVAGRPELNLPDGIHPNARGHLKVAETVAPHLAAILDRLAARAGGAPGAPSGP